jgi:hypothetical protein
MSPTELKSILQRFVDYVSDPGEKVDEVLLELCDRVVSAFHAANYDATRYAFNQDEPSPAPREDYTSRRAKISANFPDYGYYRPAAHNEDDEGEEVLGDAVDDLADLLADFEEMIWRFDHTREDDALWHFHNGYWTHWGLHMRELQLYLFRKVTRI